MARRFRGGRCAQIHSVPASYDGILRLWVLRVLVIFGGHRTLIEDRRVVDDEAMVFLGLSRFVEAEPFSAEAARAGLRAKLEQAERRASTLPTNTALGHNVMWLGSMLNLSTVERDILQLVVLQTQHPILERTLSSLGNLSFGTIHQLFSLILGHSAKEIRQALRSSGTLVRTGLVAFNLRNRWSFESKVTILGGLADNLCVKNENPLHLFRQNFVAAQPGSLLDSDYPHLAQDLSILESYLGEALSVRRQGVNVLIWGLPGTGKTQFVRMLAKRLGCALFEVATEDEDGEALQGHTRFRSYRLATSILGNGSKNLILFDEAEDVFRSKTDEFSVERHSNSGIKGWINKTLEENPVPAVWITNAAWAIDSAFMRRFDYVLEIGIPPRSVRAKVLDGYLGELGIKESWKASMAEHEGLVPAVVERAAKVVKFVQRANPEVEATGTLARVMGNTLEAMGSPREPRNLAAVVTEYRPELLNTDCDLATLKEGLEAEGHGRLCFFGPPGTGKTAFGHYLAEVLDRPLLIKRASDLQSKWVGETEQNMARMFEEARIERAVLLLDEADSFLQDRKGAQRSWEISQVNEMLTQMEGYEGIFIASTNLMGSLDAAALRRFDLKIHFDYLKPDQAWMMFQDAALRLRIQVTEGARGPLKQLNTLTPGDFANVVRQSRLRKMATASELLARLAAECEAKPEGRRKSIGF